MEWITLNTLSLGNQLSINFATDWSKDGRLFIITDNCIYVLKLNPKMTNTENILSFTKSEIRVSEYHAADHTGVNIEEILLSLTRPNMFHQILNINMTPRTKNANSPNKHPVTASWSPILGNETYKANSLLGVISNTGNLEIYVQNKFIWSLVANITQYWVEHLENEWKQVVVAMDVDDQCAVHTNRVNKALAGCFTWSKIYTENNLNYMYVIVGHLSEHISLWKVNYFNSDNEIVEPQFVYSFETDLENITCVHVHAIDNNLAWIIVGNLDGLVKSFEINLTNLQISKTVDIWTYKDIRISKIVSIGFDNNLGIIIIKGPYVVFAILNEKGLLDSIKHLNVGNINISGIELIKPGIFAITTTTGVIQKLKIIKTVKGYEIRLYPILNDLKWNYHACHGIIKSPDEILWGILVHPCKIVDHLTVRSPIQLIFCIAKNFDPGSYLRDNPCLQLANSWECIEILRCLSAKNNTLPCSWLAKIEKYDYLSLYELRLFMWISLICETFIQKRSKCRKLKMTLPSMAILKSLVYFKYRIERITLLLNKFELKKEFTEFDYNSLYLLYNAITSFQNEEIYSHYLGDSTNLEITEITEKYNKCAIETIPKCLWCEQDLSSEPCKSNHPDQRCCISGVQITGIAKWECERCGMPAHELNEDKELFCPLCDISMIKAL